MTTRHQHRQIDYEQLRAVAACVQLEDIRLIDCRFTSMIEREALDPQETLTFVRSLRGARWSFADDDARLITALTFRVKGHALKAGVEGEATTREVFDLSASWKAYYRFLKDTDRSNLELFDDFAFANGQLNIFPYLRQVVSDLTSRSGWPTVVLPVFRVPMKRPLGSVKRE